MISSKKLQNITIGILFVMISIVVSITTAKPITNANSYDFNQNQLRRNVRSFPDDYYDSLIQQNLDPLFKEHYFLRSAAKRAGKSLLLHFTVDPVYSELEFI
jgi:hypothetical protein